MKRLSLACCCFLYFSSLANEGSEKAAVLKDLCAFLRVHEGAGMLCKATENYISGNWDECLFNAYGQLCKSGNPGSVRDWCYYLRGVSFHEKQVFGAAERAFENISPGFRHYPLVILHRGGIALEREDYHAAIDWFLQLESATDREFGEYRYSMVLQDIGVCSLHLGLYQKAEEYLIRSLRMQEQEADHEALTGAYTNLGNLHYVQFDDAEAIRWFEKAYRISLQTRSFELKQNAALNLAVVEENLAAPAKALSLRKEYEAWHDSLTNQNRIWELAEREKKVAVGLKQRKIYALELENQLKQTQRNAWLVSCVCLSLMIALAAYFLWQQYKNKRVILQQKQALDVLNRSKDKLFSVISHDLRSSVSALKANNEKVGLAFSGQDFGEVGHQLKASTFLTDGIYSLLDNLLNWSMIQTRQLYFNREPIHLSSVVEQVLLNYAPIMSVRNIAVECAIAPDILVEADLDSLKIVLRNLIDNAVKYSSDGSNLHIYSLSGSYGRCELVIEDFGFGMNEQLVSALSGKTAESPVYRSKSVNGGTGLGLQLCREMLKKNDGSLEIRSQEGKGTQIHLYLPKPILHGTD